VNRKHILYTIVALAVVALGVASYLFYSKQSGSDTLADTGANGALVKVTAEDYTLGSPKAPIQFVEYAAPQCPHCAHWNEEVFPQLKKNYIDTGKVYYVFRVFPLTSVDVAVQAMAECLPRPAYFQFIDMMFRNQDKWDPDGYQIPDVHAALVNMGRIAGMSAEKVDSCISNQDQLNKIAAVGEQANKTWGLNSTPSFIVNGIVSSQPVTWAGAQALLDGLLNKKQGGS
jgi:protein-disulfide isomerase